jgi:hypothetical protein
MAASRIPIGLQAGLQGNSRAACRATDRVAQWNGAKRNPGVAPDPSAENKQATIQAACLKPGFRHAAASGYACCLPLARQMLVM